MTVMKRIPTQHWTHTSDGQPRGYIDPHALRELWFHTGTACNLACPFCLEGSKPGDDRLQRLDFEETRPLIDEALTLGVEQFSFTGGEPFVVKAFVKILDYASQQRPCLVLTNGTDAVLQRMHQIKPLADNPHPIAFRISIDHPDQARHEAGRGEGTLAQSLQSIGELLAAGFAVSVARQMSAEEDTAQVEAAYQAMFAAAGLPTDIRLVAFPDLYTPGSQVSTPEISENCMTKYQTEANRLAYMCAFSKMVVKQNGRLRVYACTLVDDDPYYDLGESLKESMQQRILLKHHRCFSCFKFGASCSELG